MRLPPLRLLAVLATAALTEACSAHSRGGTTAASVAKGPNVEGARELDQQGVRAFTEKRYAEALTFFRESHRLGGPAEEIWNIARCLENLDDVEAAIAAIEQYLASPGLPGNEREQAFAELQALRSRTSPLVVTSSPNASPVLIDGAAGPPPSLTPLATDLAPGTHTVVVHRAGYAPETRKVDAHFGRAVVISVELSKTGK